MLYMCSYLFIFQKSQIRFLKNNFKYFQAKENVKQSTIK